MGLSDPNVQARFRFQTGKYLNFSQRMCKGPCKSRRSTGQFNHDHDYCDRCFLRKPQAV